jgi:Na+-driven multidrug efflux pump
VKETKRNQGFITKNIFQKTVITMMVAELAGAIQAVVDGIVVGRFIGQTGLAAFGVETPYFSISNIINGILVVGSTAMFTRAVGKGDTEETCRVFSLTMLLGLVLSVLLGLGGFVFSGKAASLFGADESVAALHADTANYLHGVFIGAPGFILFVVLTPILQLDGDAKRVCLAALISTAVNVAGDLLVVFVFRAGMFGIGLTSAISHYTSFLIVMSHFLKKSSLFRFSFGSIRFSQTIKLFRDGFPRAVCMASRSLLPVLMNTLVLKLAMDTGVTAMSTQNTTTYVFGSLGWGIGGAMLIVGGMMVGEQDVTGMKTTVKIALKDVVLYVGMLAAAVFALSPLITSLFIPEAGEAHQMAITAIRCYAVTLLFLAFNLTSANHFQATGRSHVATIVNVGIEVACVAIEHMF